VIRSPFLFCALLLFPVETDNRQFFWQPFRRFYVYVDGFPFFLGGRCPLEDGSSQVENLAEDPSLSGWLLLP